MNKVTPEGRDKTALREPISDAPPDAVTVWYNPTLKRCVVVVQTGAAPLTGDDVEIETREGSE